MPNTQGVEEKSLGRNFAIRQCLVCIYAPQNMKVINPYSSYALETNVCGEFKLNLC